MLTIARISMGTTRFASIALTVAIGSATLAAAQDASTQPLVQPAAATSADQFTPAQLQRAQQKLAHAQQIASHLASSAQAEGLPESWRTELVGALMQSPENTYAEVQNAASARDALGAAHDQAFAASSASNSTAATGKALGDSGDDLTFFPLTSPCRIVDTRASGAGGPLTASTSRVFTFGGSLAAQGGNTCNPFTGFSGAQAPGAAALNITVDATGSTAAQGSYLAAYPDNGTAATSWLNFGGGQIIANQGILGISSSYKFDIFVSGKTNVIVDVFGSFVRPARTALVCSTVSNSQALAASTASVSFNTTATCPGGTAAVAAYCYSGNQAGIYSGGSGLTSSAFCTWINTTGAAATVFDGAICCGTPGR